MVFGKGRVQPETRDIWKQEVRSKDRITSLIHDNCAEPDCSTIGSLCKRCFALFETSHDVGLVLAEVEHIRIEIATPHKTRYGQHRKYLKFWNAIAFASRIFADQRETFFSLFFFHYRENKKKKFRSTVIIPLYYPPCKNSETFRNKKREKQNHFQKMTIPFQQIRSILLP